MTEKWLSDVHRTGWNPARASVNSPALCVLPDGRVRLWFFGGSWEGRDDVGLWTQVLTPRGEGAWEASVERRVFGVPGRSVGNAVPIQASETDLWLYVVVSEPGTWEDAVIWRLHSSDGGETYDDARLWSDTPGVLVGTPAVQGAARTWLLPLYNERTWQAWTVRLNAEQELLEEGEPVRTPRG